MFPHLSPPLHPVLLYSLTPASARISREPRVRMHAVEGRDCVAIIFKSEPYLPAGFSSTVSTTQMPPFHPCDDKFSSCNVCSITPLRSGHGRHVSWQGHGHQGCSGMENQHEHRRAPP